MIYSVPGSRALVANVTTPGDLREAALSVTTRGAVWPEVGVPNWSGAVRVVDVNGDDEVAAAAEAAVATRTRLGVPEPPLEPEIKRYDNGGILDSFLRMCIPWQPRVLRFDLNGAIE